MSLSKLKQLHVIIIGAVLCVMAGTALFFLVIKPQQEALKKAQDRYNAAEPLGNAAARQVAERNLADAIQKAYNAQQQLDAQMRRCMPDLSFSRRDTGMLALWNEQISVLGPLLEGFARDKGVAAVTAQFSIKPPPVNPNDQIFDYDVLEFPLGTVQAMGNFKDLMNNVRRWNKCQRLVMVGPPSLAGVSPNLVIAYPVTCYIFPVAKGGEKIPMAGTGTNQTMGG